MRMYGICIGLCISALALAGGESNIAQEARPTQKTRKRVHFAPNQESDVGELKKRAISVRKGSFADLNNVLSRKHGIKALPLVKVPDANPLEARMSQGKWVRGVRIVNDLQTPYLATKRFDGSRMTCTFDEIADLYTVREIASFVMSCPSNLSEDQRIALAVYKRGFLEKARQEGVTFASDVDANMALWQNLNKFEEARKNEKNAACIQEEKDVLMLAASALHSLSRSATPNSVRSGSRPDLISQELLEGGDISAPVM